MYLLRPYPRLSGRGTKFSMYPDIDLDLVKQPGKWRGQVLPTMKLLLLLAASAECAHAAATLTPVLLASLSHVGLETPSQL